MTMANIETTQRIDALFERISSLNASIGATPLPQLVYQKCKKIKILSNIFVYSKNYL